MLALMVGTLFLFGFFVGCKPKPVEKTEKIEKEESKPEASKTRRSLAEGPPKPCRRSAEALAKAGRRRGEGGEKKAAAAAVPRAEASGPSSEAAALAEVDKPADKPVAVAAVTLSATPVGIGACAHKGPKDARVTILEFSDYQ